MFNPKYYTMKKNNRRLLVATFSSLIILFPHTCPSQWQKTGDLIARIPVSTLAADGKTLAAGTLLGDIYLSQDSGTSWSWLNKFGERGAVNELYIRGDTVLSACDSGGLYLFSKNGYQWGTRISAVAGNRAFCIASRENALFVGTNAGLFLSVDNGTTWRVVDIPWTKAGVSAFCKVGPAIFAASNGNGVYTSKDTGEVWAPRKYGLPQKAYVASIAGASGKLFASVEIDSAIPDSVITPNSRVYVSVDSGYSWDTLKGELRKFSALLQIGDHLLAGTPAGLFRSPDRGVTWTMVNPGVPDSSVTSLSTIGSTIFAGFGHFGIFRSTDAGVTWHNACSGLTDKDIRCLAVHRGNLVAGTGRSVHVSFNNGAAWTGCPGLFRQVWSLASTDTLIIAGAARSYSTGGIFCSADNGVTWKTDKYGPSSAATTSFAVNGEYIFAGQDGFQGMYRSDRSALNWSVRNSGLIVYHGTSSYNVNIAALTTIGTTVVTGTDEGIYFSTDNGEHWDSAGYSTTACAFASTGTDIFAATGKNGILHSTDFGKTWTPTGPGIANRHVASLAAYGASIFAGTDSGWVYLSSDTGTTWATIGTGLSADTVRALATKGDTLYAGLSGTGVWRLPLSGLVSTTQPRIPAYRENAAVPISLRQNGSSVLAITLLLAHAQRVRTALYDMRGAEVTSRFTAIPGAGRHTLTIDITTTAAGCYTLHIQSGAQRTTRRIILTR
jgi:photosystem II stability/assembly factor-like uncharacterized protein